MLGLWSWNRKRNEPTLLNFSHLSFVIYSLPVFQQRGLRSEYFYFFIIKASKNIFKVIFGRNIKHTAGKKKKEGPASFFYINGKQATLMHLSLTCILPQLWADALKWSSPFFSLCLKFLMFLVTSSALVNFSFGFLSWWTRLVVNLAQTSFSLTEMERERELKAETPWRFIPEQTSLQLPFDNEDMLSLI